MAVRPSSETAAKTFFSPTSKAWGSPAALSGLPGPSTRWYASPSAPNPHRPSSLPQPTKAIPGPSWAPSRCLDVGDPGERARTPFAASSHRLVTALSRERPARRRTLDRVSGRCGPADRRSIHRCPRGHTMALVVPAVLDLGGCGANSEDRDSRAQSTSTTSVAAATVAPATAAPSSGTTTTAAFSAVDVTPASSSRSAHHRRDPLCGLMRTH